MWTRLVRLPVVTSSLLRPSYFFTRSPSLALLPTRLYASKKNIKSNASKSKSSLDPFLTHMQQSIHRLKQDLSGLVMGRASPVLLDAVVVSYKSKKVSLKNVAQVAVKDGQTLIVNVSDEEFTQAVIQSIQNAGLGLNPIKVDATVLHVKIPRMSKEAKEVFTKNVQQMGEKSKRQLRDVRQDARTEIKKCSEGLSRDQLQKTEKEIQKHVDQSTKQVESLLEAKLKQSE